MTETTERQEISEGLRNTLTALLKAKERYIDSSTQNQNIFFSRSCIYYSMSEEARAPRNFSEMGPYLIEAMLKKYVEVGIMHTMVDEHCVPVYCFRLNQDRLADVRSLLE